MYGEIPEPIGSLLPSKIPRLEQGEISSLVRPVTNEEIKIALFDMIPLKALGSDGFHTFFFQKQWSIVGGAVCDWVRKVFNGGVIDADLNNTLIVLIPKVANPKGLLSFDLLVFVLFYTN